MEPKSLFGRGKSIDMYPDYSVDGSRRWTPQVIVSELRSDHGLRKLVGKIHGFDVPTGIRALSEHFQLKKLTVEGKKCVTM